MIELIKKHKQLISSKIVAVYNHFIYCFISVTPLVVFWFILLDSSYQSFTHNKQSNFH